MAPQPFLRNLWYYALPSAALKKGRMLGKLFLGEPIVLARRGDGSVFALRDVCPHRAMPLSCGQFDGREVECCYHGWRFDNKGACTRIPSLTGHEDVDPAAIKVRSYPLQESQGGLWIFIGDSKDLPPVPIVPGVQTQQRPVFYEKLEFPCFIDHAVVGLMDPAHGPFVHTSWWWRSRKSIHEKAKAFGAAHLGFVMKRHRPSKNSFAYKLLGGTPETEIAFQLPGIRIEHIQIGKHSVSGLTCVTPVDEDTTEITHSLYTDIGWLKLIAPVARIFVRRFLNQDRTAVVRQQVGLKHEEHLLLIRDADTQARWYYQLRNEWIRAAAENRTFVNPIKDVTLRWRS